MLRLFPKADRERFRHAPANDSERRAAWLDMLFVDYGILRLAWKNRARLAARAWRMNQPMPQDIEWAAKQGIRTVISARHDPRHGGNALTLEACARHGIAFHVVPIFSREAPSRQAILDAAALFQMVEHPILIHCKSGADRAGFLAALHRIVIDHVPVAEARKQLSLRFLHIRQSKTGILDAVFDAYLKDDPEESSPFLVWVAERYDPTALMRDFRYGLFADIVDRLILRHE